MKQLQASGHPSQLRPESDQAVHVLPWVVPENRAQPALRSTSAATAPALSSYPTRFKKKAKALLRARHMLQKPIHALCPFWKTTACSGENLSKAMDLSGKR